MCTCVLVTTQHIMRRIQSDVRTHAGQQTYTHAGARCRGPDRDTQFIRFDFHLNCDQARSPHPPLTRDAHCMQIIIN